MKSPIRFLFALLSLLIVGLFLQTPGPTAVSNTDTNNRAPADTVAADTAAQPEGGFFVSEPVQPTLSPAVRDLPDMAPEILLDREVNPRMNFSADIDPFFRSFGDLDPLLAVQAAAPPTMAPPTLLFNFDGLVTGSNPHDPVGDVGLNYYIQATNGGGSAIRIIDKTSGDTVQDFTLDSLGSGNCANGLGDPIILYDHLAGRWFLSEFSSGGNRLCIYISQTGDPLGNYHAYEFQSANSFPDYPKYGVWPDAYYAGTNESSPTAYAFERAKMLNGEAASFQAFNFTSLSGFGFQQVPPADVDGPAPPAGRPGIFMRHRDTEVHGAGACPDAGTQDCLEIFEFTVDWDTPGNSSLDQVASLPVTDFDSDLCGLTSFFCFPQQGSSTTLDPLREVIMWRLQYRHFNTHETLVATHVTDIDGADWGGVRWYELRKQGGGDWTVFQEGTYAPDDSNRFMSSGAMDGSGNIAIAYSVSDENMFPSIRYTGREESDPLGTMAPEVNIHDGTGSSGSNRWGDYSSLNVDPVDHCTFWYTMEYGAGGTRRTRIASFRFDSCSGQLVNPAVAMTLPVAAQTAVPGQPVTYTVSLTNTGNITDSYTLIASAKNWPPVAPDTIGPLPPGVATQFNVIIDPTAGDGRAPDALEDRFTVQAISNLLDTVTARVIGVTTLDVNPGITAAAETGFTGLINQTVVHTITLSNSGDYTDTFSLAVGGNNWPTTLSHSSVGPLGPGQQEIVTAQVTVGEGGSDSATITIASALDNNLTEEVTLTSNGIYPAASWLPAATAESGQTGTAVSHVFTLTNDASFPNTFNLALDGYIWPTSGPSSIGPLAPGATAQVAVQVNIPASLLQNGWPVASDTFTLTAVSEVGGNVLATTGGATTAEVTAGVTTAVAGPGSGAAHVGGSVTYTVQISNSGAHTDVFAIALSGHTWPSSAPAQVGPLAPGESGNVVVQVTVAAPGVDSVTVTATSALDDSVQQELNLTTRSLYRQFLPAVVKP